MNDHTPNSQTKGLAELTQQQFLALIANVGDPDPSFMACTGKHAFAIARAAYQMGADAELEACCEWLENGPYGFSVAASASDLIGSLQAARRPKPPSLREQALAVLNDRSGFIDAAGEKTLRRAIEALPE